MTLLIDLRQALRSLRKSRGYSLACIAILALGIGANTAIFALLDSVILKPLPYPDSERLVFLWNRFPGMQEPFASKMPAMRGMYEGWRHAQSFTDVGVFAFDWLIESGVERPEHLKAELVSTNLLPLLGAQPAHGRLFRPDEERPGHDQVVILSDAYFAKRFNRDPNVVGRTLGFDGIDYTVAGVLSADFSQPAVFGGANRWADVFVPISRYWTPQRKGSESLFVPARLKPGVSIEQARSEVSVIGEQLKKANPESYPPNFGTNVTSFVTEGRAPGVERRLQFLLGAVGFFLLIACANLANLTLTRLEHRSREIAVRIAIGATRGRIIRHLALESLVLSAAGAIVGLIVAMWLTPALAAWAPDELNSPDVFTLRWPVFVFSALATVLTTILFGLLPAFLVGRGDAYAGLKSGGLTSTISRARSRQVLTAVEVALSLVLLIGAGLMVRTLINLVRAPLGIDIDRLAGVEIHLPDRVYADDASREQFLSAVARRIREIPGVQSAAVTTNLPMASFSSTTFSIQGHPTASGEVTSADQADVTPEYLDTMGIPISAGRGFTAQDVERNRGKGEGVALVNRTFVQKFLAGDNPIGRRLVANGRTFEIVGVTADFHVFGPAEPVHAQFFRAGVREATAYLVLRAAGPPLSLTEAVRQAFWAVDKGFVTVQLISARDAFYEGPLADQVFALSLLGAFAVLGLLLAMTGIYSVLAHLVASRRREIGIRMAIGASTSVVGRMVARQTVRPVVVGLVAGVLASLALTRVLDATLFETSPRDPLTILLAVLAVLLVIPFAIWTPMRRAMSVECAAVLREE